MSNDKLQVARQLIQERNYDAARAVLNTIPDDPTAQRWLTKLDELAPPTIPIPPVTSTKPLKSLALLPLEPLPQRSNTLKIVLGIVGILLICALIIFVSIQPSLEQGNANARAFLFCLDWFSSMGDLEGMDGCSEWAFPDERQPYQAEFVTCHRQAPGDRDAGFANCLFDKDALPPGINPR